MACENGFDGLHASRSMIKARVGTRSVRASTRVLTRRTELLLHKKRKRQNHRSARPHENNLKFARWQGGHGAQRGISWTYGVGAHTWAGVVWHCESCTLVHATYSLFRKRWVDSRCSTVLQSWLLTLLPGYLLCGRFWFFFVEAWDEMLETCFSVVMAQHEKCLAVFFCKALAS